MWSTGSSAHAPHIGTPSASPIRHNRQISVPPIMPRIQQPYVGLSIGGGLCASAPPQPPASGEGKGGGYSGSGRFRWLPLSGYFAPTSQSPNGPLVSNDPMRSILTAIS